jgi:hypothetical protein
MTTEQAHQNFEAIKKYYDAIDYPKYRNADLPDFKDRYQQLLALKIHLESNVLYNRLVNAMSQVIARVEEQTAPPDKAIKNLSERGLNKAIPCINRRTTNHFPFEYRDKWGNACYVNHGYWTAKNYRVMDALGYMLLLKEGGDRLPTGYNPIFDDLMDIENRELQLNGACDGVSKGIHSSVVQSIVYSIGFSDDHFRQHTGLKISSAEILNLLLETSRVEFKLCFPVRLKDTGNQEKHHHMNYYSRFFEIKEQEIRVRKDGIVQLRRYRVTFNTLLGELFVNNLKARFNDWVDKNFYKLPDSAQLFYRRIMLHNDKNDIPVLLATIAKSAGLYDANQYNLISTVEKNILEPLKGLKYIHSYTRCNGLGGVKYQICRKAPKLSTHTRRQGR